MNKLNLVIVGILIIMSIPAIAQETTDSLNQAKLLEMFQRIKVKQEAAKVRKDSMDRVVKERCKPGNIVFNFQFQDMAGDMVSLNDFRGKYVYIDVWASWCGPCQWEIPYWQKLEKQFHKRKIVFVSISMDGKVEDWKRTVKDRKLDGIQLYHGGDSHFFNEFGVTYIPRFILLDKQGRIVDAYMTNPSEDATQKTLKKLKGI